MHTIRLSSPFVLGEDDVILPGEYVTDDVAGAQLLAYAGEGEMNHFTMERPFNEAADWNGKHILFMRTGGFGDLILLTPILREIAARWPLAIIDVCCVSEYAQALMNLPYVNATIKAPIALEALVTKYDCWIMLENVVERHPQAKKLHYVDLIAKHIGLTGNFNKLQDYRVTDHERIWAEQAYPRKSSQRRLCVQIDASARNRTYSRQKTGQVVAAMLKKGWEVFIMGRPGEIKIEERPSLRLLTDGFSFRQRCAVIETADCVLAPDSSLTHIAGALGVPCIALFGPFPWANRTKYAPGTTSISGVGKCSPCFHHATHAHNQFPPNCPSARTGHCEVLESIAVDRIIAKIEENARKFSLSPVE